MIRFFDIVLSFLGLVLCLPLFIVVALCISLDSRGGIFYSQLRELGVLATKQKCLVIQLLGLGVITSAQMKLS